MPLKLRNPLEVQVLNRWADDIELQISTAKKAVSVAIGTASAASSAVVNNVYQFLQSVGVTLPQRKNINFSSAFVLTDNLSGNATNVSLGTIAQSNLPTKIDLGTFSGT
jgi:hypothetical protein